MTIDQASDIVIGCIRRVSNFTGDIDDGEKKLSSFNVSGLTLESLKDCIVNVGVPSVGHTLDIAFLGSVSGSWKLLQLVLQVQHNSVSGNVRPAVVRAMEAIKKMGASR